MSWNPRVPTAAGTAPRWGSDGFTLIETLVAFAVLAGVSAVLFRSVVGIRAGAGAFDDRTQAAVIARSILDESIADRTLKTGTISGTRNGRAWTLKASPVDLASQLPSPPPEPPHPGPASDATAAKAPIWVPQRLVVRVAAGSRPVETETIRLVRAR